MSLKWKLPAGWKSRDDLSWRASTWALRRMGTGGMIVESATAEERQNAKIADGSMGLRVKFVGQFGAHAVAKAAGIRANDLVVSFDGQTNLARESDLIAYAVTKRKPGEKVEVKWLRNGKEMKASILMQE
jgi:S1-C subfamily serine protease